MIRITVELLPFGSEQRRQELGQINIVNDGTGDVEVGNYDVTLVKDGGIVRHIPVRGHHRSEGWEELLWTAIDEGLLA